jgi:hypothetical protein
MHDERAEHPHHFLHRHVRVIEKGPRLMQCKFVDEAASGQNRILADAGAAVHAVWNFKSMPVHGSRFRQVVVDDDPHAIALGDLNGRSRRAAVITPEVHRFVRYKLPLYRFSNQMENLDAVIERER